MMMSVGNAAYSATVVLQVIGLTVGCAVNGRTLGVIDGKG
jgi:hypothetical protein